MLFRVFFLAISSLRLDLSFCLCYIYDMRKGV